MKYLIHFWTLGFVLNILLLSNSVLYAQNCSVPNPENRRQVQRLSKPYDFIAQVSVHRKVLASTWYVSTGSFVSKNVLITAGHTFNHLSRVKDVTIYIGKRDTNGKTVWLYTKTYNKKALKFYIAPEFEDNENADFDYSMVAFPENIVKEYFNLTKLANVPATCDSLFISGYPGDKFNEDGVNSEQLWTKGDKKENIYPTQNVLLYSMFTVTGDSGAPVWATNNGQYFLVGVHGTGFYGNGHNNCNAGISINDSRIITITKFVTENTISN
jgi:V8-like Glu-specific endopeptidase